MWIYKSPIGMLIIKHLPDGRYGLVYNEQIWETCKSPHDVADDVYLHCTGCIEWDMLDGQIQDVPTNLLGWEIG